MGWHSCEETCFTECSYAGYDWCMLPDYYDLWVPQDTVQPSLANCTSDCLNWNNATWRFGPKKCVGLADLIVQYQLPRQYPCQGGWFPHFHSGDGISRIDLDSPVGVVLLHTFWAAYGFSGAFYDLGPLSLPFLVAYSLCGRLNVWNLTITPIWV